MRQALTENPVAAAGPAPDFDTLQQAAEWYAVLRDHDCTAADRQRWTRWVQAREAHRQAWSYVEQVSGRFDVLAGQAGAALGAGVLRASGQRRRRVLRLCLAWGAAGVAGLFTVRGTPWRSWHAGLRTGVGEVREEILADGTHLWLDTDTAVEPRYDDHRRLLRLYAGEILVDTAADPRQRPFLVCTDQGLLRALGTRFSVRCGPTDSTLDVFDGAVELSCADTGERRRVAAGERAVFTRSGIAPAATADPARHAWARGVLLADSLPLADFLAELGRYRRGYLGCDPAVAGLRVMGNFPLADTDHALAMLEAVLPVKASRTLPWWVVVRAVPFSVPGSV